MEVKKTGNTKIAVLGTATSLHEAPVADASWDIWAITQIHRMHKDFRNTSVDHRTRWFEIHGKSKWEHEGLVDYYKWLADAAKNRFPVYLKEPNPHVPDGTVYPKDRMLERFAPYPYVTCTCSWMIMLAIDELTEEVTLPDGRKIQWAIEGAEIGIWGIDMMVADKTFGQEYSYQRPSVEYYLGMAQACGIKIYVPDTCDILKCAYWYGYKDDNPFRNRNRARMDQLGQSEKQLAQQVQAGTNKLSYIKGAKDYATWIDRAHMPGDEGDAAGIAPGQFSNVLPQQGQQPQQGPSRTIQVDNKQMDAIMKQLQGPPKAPKK